MSPSFTHRTHKGLLSLLAAASSLAFLTPAKAQNPDGITTVFYILLENRCFTSGTDTSQSNILYNNKNGGSPYLTALCTPGNTAYTVNYQGQTIPQTAHSAFSSCYHHVFATANGDSKSPYFVENETANQPQGQSVHPSEPNYVFMEAGSNLSILNDNEPYGSGGSVAAINSFLAAHKSFTGQNLSALLQNAGISWTSYNEGTCLLSTTGLDYNSTRPSNALTNNVAAPGVRTVPLSSFSGTSASYTNPYNGSHQYNFATKHTGQLFFPATNGTTGSTANTSPSNPSISHYAPLEQLATDLASNTQAQYCVITPDQFNDGHTALSATFTYHNYGGTNSGVNQTFTGGSDLARVGQMDNFCAILVPQIMSSPVYQAGHAAIVIWTDETEGGNDFYHTLTNIIISPLSKGNAYNSTLNMTHATDIATLQEIFGVAANTPTGYLNDAANPSVPTPAGTTVTVNNGQGLQVATGQPFPGFGTGITQDMADLYQPGVIPQGIPALTYTPSGYSFNRRTNQYSQTVTVTNMASAAVSGPIYVLVSGLQNATLTNSAGTSATYYPGSPYVLVSNGLAAGASAVVTLTFNSTGTISDLLEVVAPGSGTP